MSDGENDIIMEYNKDESVKCFEIAAESLTKGDKGRAFKFALKSERLYPSKKAKELLEKINRLGGVSDEDANSKHVANENVSRRRNGRSNHISDQCTEEEVNAVNWIKQCQDYYEILGVAKDASESEIKKGYRKLALQFHPDKNHAPGAIEAFKAIGNAFSVLSNRDKRRQYDMSSSSRSFSANHKHSQQQWDFTHGFESEMTPEEIFNMFFSGSELSNNRNCSNGSTAHTFRRHRRVNNENWSQLLRQISPIFVLVILSIASFAFVDEQQYSFVPSTKFSKRRVSESLNVEYFVSADFTEKHNRHSARRVEREAEKAFVINLRDKCRKETVKKEQMLKARPNDARMHSKTDRFETQYCQQLQKLQRMS